MSLSTAATARDITDGVMMNDFAQRVALITGGTSGIGLATAHIMLSSGAKVALIGSNIDKAESAMRSLAGFDENVTFVQGDISLPTECEKVIRHTVGHFGKIDIVVNSAGVYLEKLITEVTEEDYDFVMNINVKGTYFICKYAIPELKKPGNGAIVNVSSDAGLNGNLLCTTYCASKGAVTTFTKALALELCPYNIRVNCVCPGDIDTPMLKKYLSEVDNPTQKLQDLINIYPMGRIGRPEEAAEAICFLASDRASFITGIAMPIDGGLTAC